MNKLVIIALSFVLSNIGFSSAFAGVTLSPSSLKSLSKDEFTGKLVEIIYCKKGSGAPCYQASNEQLIRANIKASSGSNIFVDFRGEDLAFGEKLISLVGKKIHAKFSPIDNNYTYDVQYINISE